jgi:hypothetical protein
MSHDKIKAAARRRMARTGESYATARRRVIAERMAEDGGRADAARMGDPVLTTDEIRAAAAAHGELGPEYSDAVVASFLERVDEEIAARIDARLADAGLAEARPPGASVDQDTRRTLLTGIAIGVGIGAFAAVAVGGNPYERMHRLLFVLVALAVICAVSAVYARRHPVSPRSAAPPRPGVTALPHQDRRW